MRPAQIFEYLKVKMKIIKVNNIFHELSPGFFHFLSRRNLTYLLTLDFSTFFDLLIFMCEFQVMSIDLKT
jgi:hypothetical protein